MFHLWVHDHLPEAAGTRPASDHRKVIANNSGRIMICTETRRQRTAVQQRRTPAEWEGCRRQGVPTASHRPLPHWIVAKPAGTSVKGDFT